MDIFCKKDVPVLSQVSPYWVKLFSKRILINPPQFCFVLSRRSRQVPAFYILWSLTCFVIILAFFPTIFQLELWPLGLLSNYLYHSFFCICLCSSQICKILCCVWSWKMIELKQSIEALNSCGVVSCILFRTYVAWQLPDKLPTLFLIKSLLCSKFEVKSFLFSNDHRGARKMNLFYYRGCVNHNIKVPPI